MDGKVWDRQEAGQKHHIAGIPNKAVQHQVHYTQNNNARVPSDVVKGNEVGSVFYRAWDAWSRTRMVAYGIFHDGGGGRLDGGEPFDLTLNLPDSATVYIGPS